MAQQSIDFLPERAGGLLVYHQLKTHAGSYTVIYLPIISVVKDNDFQIFVWIPMIFFVGG